MYMLYVCNISRQCMRQAIKETAIGENSGDKYSGTIDKFCFVSESCLPTTLPAVAMSAVEANPCR